MAMTASQFFSRSAAGSLSEESAMAYDSQMQDYYTRFDGATGWLKEAVDKTKQLHDTFMSSRMWEFSKIAKGEVGTFVGRYEIGYLGSLYAQRGADGFMRDIIMANPTVMELFEAERLTGYDTDLHRYNTGLGNDNYFYRKVTDGVVTIKHGDEMNGHSIYLNTRDDFAHYSARERMGAKRTWRASDAYVKNGYNPTSTLEQNIFSVEEVEERKQAKEIEDKNGTV